MLEICNLSASWKISKKSDSTIFSNVNFTLPQNELTALCGINGSGKSTLLSVIAKIIPNNLNYSGKILVNGKPLPNNLKERAKLISYLTQTETNIWDISVEDLIKNGRYAYQKWYETNTSQDTKIIDSAMCVMQLEHLKNRTLSTLSGGELQRVRIARSLVQETPYILLDEPLAGLDLVFQKELILLLKDLCKKGKTIFISIHDINFASLYTNNLVLLKKNRTGIVSGSPQKVMTADTLKEIFTSSFEIFNHPITNVKQVY